jgi:hypothetical protein
VAVTGIVKSILPPAPFSCDGIPAFSPAIALIGNVDRLVSPHQGDGNETDCQESDRESNSLSAIKTNS